MKVKVIRTFVFNKCLYSAENIAEFSIDEVGYLNSTSLGNLVKEINDINGIKASKKEEYDKLTKKKLVEIAKDKNIQVDESMTKKEIIEELV